VGGKAASLERARDAGLPAPVFAVIGPDDVRTLMESDAGDLRARRARELVEAALEGLGSARVAVRSSGAGEDGEASFAGQLHSCIGVSGLDPVIDAVRLQLGARWGLTCAAGDILKAFVPVLVLRIAFPGGPYLYAAALGALIGHNWPVFHRFKGGRGQSPMLGGMLAIAPLGAVVCSVAGFVLGYYVIRDAMTSDSLGQLFYIPWVWVAGLGPWAIAWALAANIIFFGSYAGEIRQYAAGRIGGHLRDPDDVMRMMRMDYEWMPRASRRTPIDDTSSDESR
jgi:glycerol-3-phosphate acyltransferase PlsY